VAFPALFVANDTLAGFEALLETGLRTGGAPAFAADTPATHAASPHSSSTDRERPDRRRLRVIGNSGPEACDASARL
jgi:hypothetical protein